jgi:hypothetical protein
VLGGLDADRLTALRDGIAALLDAVTEAELTVQVPTSG